MTDPDLKTTDASRVPPQAVAGTPRNLFTCDRCGITYDWRKSSSCLKMTFCGVLCEIGKNGLTIDHLLSAKRVPKS